MNDEIVNVGKKWLQEEDDLLVKEIEENKTFEEIALNHKRNIRGIEARVITNIIYPKYKNETDINYEELSKEYNIDSLIIKRYITKKQNVITETKTNKELDYLINLDKKLDEINEKLDKLIVIFNK